MASGSPPNYYAVLDISDKATAQQIRDAYKKAALKTHPDRVPADSPERATRTRKFQLVNDAYYTLSDPTRRRDYDAQRKMYGGSSFGGGAAKNDSFEFDDPEEEEIPNSWGANAGPGGAAGNGGGGAQSAYSWAWNFFTGQNKGAAADENARKRNEDAQFADVFEEMLREEGLAEDGTNKPTSAFWSLVGGMSGGALGFIVGNVPGLLAGAVAGNRLGSIRDTKGKSVYAVFQELPQADRARLLTQLAAKVFSHTVGV